MNKIKKHGAAILLTVVSALFLTSCVDRDTYRHQGDDPKEYNKFDFSTTGDVSLRVAYTNTGVEANVFFELYDEMPVNETNAGYIKIEGKKALFSAFTDENGLYEGTIQLPKYVEKVWVYSPTFFAKTLLEASVVDGQLTVTDADATKAIARNAATRGTDEHGYSYMTRTDCPKEYQGGKRWKEWLGTYNTNGKISYAYKGTDLVAPASLYTTHSQVINVNTSCPQKYRNSADLEVEKPAEIVVTMLGGNTCWNSSLGYYYYKVGQEPKSIDDLNVIMLFPNTQDGKWCKTNQASDRALTGVDRMTAVKLKYYPNIDHDNMDGATTVFPAGYKVGLVMATNAWSKRLDYQYGNKEAWLKQNRYYRAATNPAMSIRQNGQSTTLPVVASYYSANREFTIVSFEDDYKFEDNKGNDQNFSDVVLAIGTNPVAAFADIPEADIKMNADGSGPVTLYETLSGTYLYEDLWPSQGDYDLNDVAVEYTYGHNSDKWNDTYGETFSFRVRQNYATKHNGVAFRLIGGKRKEVNANGGTTGRYIEGFHKPHSVKLYINGKDATASLQYDEAEQVYYVIPDVKAKPDAIYTVEFEHYYKGAPTHYERNFKEYKTDIDVFIYRKESDDFTWEVHTAGMKPTSHMNMKYFGLGDDQSDPNKGIYYVRKGNYPYALFLNGSPVDLLEKLFDNANEGKSIDMIFPRYKSWVESNGANDANWYK